MVTDIADVGRSVIKDLWDSPPPNTLKVLTGWPASSACDQGSRVAMPKGGPPVTAIDLDDFQKEPRNIAAEKGAASWGRGVLNLTLSTEGKGKISVESVVPHVKGRTQRTAYDWVLQKTESCGGGGGGPSHLHLDLERQKLFDVVDGKLAAHPVPGNSMITGKTVTRDEPAYVTVSVSSCKASYEWSLTVTYLLGGKRKQTELGPFRSTGQVAGVPVYDIRPESTGTGRVLVDTKETTKATCAKRTAR
ncbi:hypothetical protein ACFV0R_01265 [Streptomyces sp. NPDC059578]|uniref:hypothetical protein n=1 Tax=Streptomyces sp. NPDC059578 TaxID=3346874 RepID=UPI0036C238E1